MQDTRSPKSFRTTSALSLLIINNNKKNNTHTHIHICLHTVSLRSRNFIVLHGIVSRNLFFKLSLCVEPLLTNLFVFVSRSTLTVSMLCEFCVDNFEPIFPLPSMTSTIFIYEEHQTFKYKSNIHKMYNVPLNKSDWLLWREWNFLPGLVFIPRDGKWSERVSRDWEEQCDVNQCRMENSTAPKRSFKWTLKLDEFEWNFFVRKMWKAFKRLHKNETP